MMDTQQIDPTRRAQPHRVKVNRRPPVTVGPTADMGAVDIATGPTIEQPPAIPDAQRVVILRLRSQKAEAESAFRGAQITAKDASEQYLRVSAEFDKELNSLDMKRWNEAGWGLCINSLEWQRQKASTPAA